MMAKRGRLRRALIGRGFEPRAIPHDTARRVKPISLDFGRVASPPRELKFDFHLVESNRLAAKYTALSASAPAELADRRSRRQSAILDRFARGVSQRALVGHSGPPESEDSIAASPHEIRETSKVRIRNFPATGVKRRDG